MSINLTHKKLNKSQILKTLPDARYNTKRSLLLSYGRDIIRTGEETKVLVGFEAAQPTLPDFFCCEIPMSLLICLTHRSSASYPET